MAPSIQMEMLLLSFLMVGLTNANYQIGYTVQSITFNSPNNILSDGSCCNSTCGSNLECCDASSTRCSPTLRFCFRRSEHPMEDSDSRCPYLDTGRKFGDQRIIVMGTDTKVIESPYSGGFQAYLRFSHSEEEEAPDFEPPFSDPLIDEVFFEVAKPALLFEDRLDVALQNINSSGKFGRVMVEMTFVVHCTEGWNGTACEMLCSENGCIIIEPPTTTESELSATTDSEPRGSLPSPTSAGVLVSTNAGNVVGIAVGVSVGVVVFILLVVLVVIVIIIATKRKLTWRRTFKPETATVSYTLKKPVKKEDIQAIPSLEPLNGTQDVYATVNKNKRRANSDDNRPPPVAPYVPTDYTPMESQEDVVYQNFSVMN